MSNIEPVALSTLPHAPRSRAFEARAARFSPLVILGSMLLAAGCTDIGGNPDDDLVDAGFPDAGSLDAGLPDAAIPEDAPGPAKPVYFLVAELPGKEVHDDSYVLPLTRADHIAHARDLIRRGPEAAGTHIVVATVRAGADGINRDLRAKDAAAWSWHVSGVIDFADATMEILDGWPSFVEEDVTGWISNTCFDDETATEGTLGFWGYTVVDELGGYPESLPENLP
ncbi:MAG TPA: hypothetical protein VNM90_21665 [Haliangium sp.]|nr:hypothetical protein [Haliangium sp.]